MLPFWLWPYRGRMISAFVLLLLVYLVAPDFFVWQNIWWVAVVAYLAGHWLWYYWRKYINRRIIAFDVGGVIAQGDYFTEHELRKSYVTAVLSNNNRLVDPGFQQRFRAGDMFDVVYYSSDLGAKKPDPTIYKKFASYIGVSPHRIVFFDDDAANVEAAKKVGFNAHVFKSASQVMEMVKLS